MRIGRSSGKLQKVTARQLTVYGMGKKIEDLNKILDTLQIKSLMPYLKNLMIQHPLSGKPPQRPGIVGP